jgi:hypothetical protein
MVVRSTNALTTSPISKIAAPWFWTDLRITRDFSFGKAKDLQRASLSFEVRNIFNNKNSQIINGVTGKAYRDGDPLPYSVRDPNYPDPQDRGLAAYGSGALPFTSPNDVGLKLYALMRRIQYTLWFFGCWLRQPCRHSYCRVWAVNGQAFRP